MDKSLKIIKNPKISVIVPVYNVENYIEKCLISLVEQTIDNFQIILIDDGSKDNSGKILDEYEKKYSNIIVKHIKNGGVANARNVGLKLATGEYIGFMDSDDYVELDMYEKMYNKAITSNFDIVSCDAKLIYPKKNIVVSNGSIFDIINDEKSKKNYLINSYAVIWNKIYKKNLIKNIKFMDKSNFCEDVEFLYRVIPLCKSIGIVNEPFYNYVQRQGSLTYVYDEKIYQLISNFDGLVNLYKNNKKYSKYLEELEYSYTRYLYATFIKRMAKTKNKNKFSEAINLVIKKVNFTFPNYKLNKYIKKITFKNLYLRYFNRKIAKIIYIKEKNKLN